MNSFAHTTSQGDEATESQRLIRIASIDIPTKRNFPARVFHSGAARCHNHDESTKDSAHSA